MKNKIIALLKDESLSKIELYNKLLTFLSEKRGLFAIRNFQNGYSEFKYESIQHEIKKDYEISDLDIYEFSGEETEEVANDADKNLLSDEEIAAAKVAHDVEVEKRKNENPQLYAFIEDLEKDEPAKTGFKLIEEYPFLDDPATPDEMKLLVQDKFTAYRNLSKNHAALVEGLEENEAKEKIYDLAKSVVTDFQLEADIKKELDFYKAQGKVLGNHPRLNDLAIHQEITDLKEPGLVEMKHKAQKNASKARTEIENKGTNEGREKRVSDWTLRGKLATERLEKEFKKK